MKRRYVQGTLLAVLLLAAPAALAQVNVAATSPAATAGEAPQVAAPFVESAAPAAPTPPAAAASTLEARLGAVESKLAGTEETVGAMQVSVDGLKKLKISGFVQGRYEYHQDAMDGWLNYKNQNRFYVRHAYLGAKYEGKNGEYFVQIDGNNNDGVVLKDAEATFVDTWTPLNLRLTIGQFKVPFGYEIGQSDADRELPERAQVILGLFPGDRDRGARLQASYDIFRLKVALVNGASFGQKDPSDYKGVVQNGFDPNGFKTVVGRLGADLGFLAGGISGLWGRTLDTKWPDPTKSDLGSMYYFEQLRLGADAQGYIDVPQVGGLAVKGEIIWARKTNLDYPVLGPANTCLNSQSLGWMLTVVQNIGPYLGVALRFDQFDPLLSSTVDSRCYDSSSATKSRDKDRLSRLGAALVLHGSANIKFTLSYEHPWEQSGAKKSNDIVTTQLQARF
jgi:hypothetical protein